MTLIDANTITQRILNHLNAHQSTGGAVLLPQTLTGAGHGIAAKLVGTNTDTVGETEKGQSNFTPLVMLTLCQRLKPLWELITDGGARTLNNYTTFGNGSLGSPIDEGRSETR